MEYVGILLASIGVSQRLVASRVLILLGVLRLFCGLIAVILESLGLSVAPIESSCLGLTLNRLGNHQRETTLTDLDGGGVTSGCGVRGLLGVLLLALVRG